MKKEPFVAIICALSILCVATVGLLLMSIFSTARQLPKLSEEYYGISSYTEVGSSEFDELRAREDTFIVFIHQPFCVTSNEFNDVLTEFMERDDIGIVKIKFADLKKTNLAEDIKRFPSAAVITNGKLAAYLDASSEDDEKYYQTVDNFEQWVSRFVEIKNDQNVSEVE